jgi:hypothetical protein
MSLVVARRFGDSVFIVSDTKVTLPSQRQSAPTDGVIKTVILNPNLSVCFAGILEFADAAMHSFDRRESGGGFERIVDHFFKHHVKSDRLTDFAILFGGPNYRLVKVSDGIASESQAVWLGDQAAFEVFQRAMTGQSNLPAPPTGGLRAEMKLTVGSDAEEYSKMKDAMTSVITDHSASTVGGFVTTVGYVINGENVGLPNGFNYLDYFDAYTHDLGLKADSLLPDVRFSSAPEGGFNFYFLRGYQSDGSQVVAAYFPQGSFGLVYLPCARGWPRHHIVRDNPDVDFANVLRSSFGITLPAWPGRQYTISSGRR